MNIELFTPLFSLKVVRSFSSRLRAFQLTLYDIIQSQPFPPSTSRPCGWPYEGRRATFNVDVKLSLTLIF